MKNIFFIILLGFLHNCSENNSNSNKILLGEKIYSNNCISCHESGMAPDLTYHKLELSEIISIVKYGKNSMPSYKDMLSEKEIESVSYYLYKKN
ncbi:cytochrome c [Pelagibacteraceae bacterium]|nr:cytochrome c [Pelagibacteraceae bacterium]